MANRDAAVDENQGVFRRRSTLLGMQLNQDWRFYAVKLMSSALENMQCNYSVDKLIQILTRIVNCPVM